MESIRCACGALLLKAAADATIDGVEVKCRRRGRLNHIRQRAQSSPQERPGASTLKDGRPCPDDRNGGQVPTRRDTSTRTRS